MLGELDLKSLWKELDDFDLEIETESTLLQEVWLKIAELKEKNERESIELAMKTELQFLHHELNITLNIGGQYFETTVGILTRDPFSILAACCRQKALFRSCEEGQAIFFDRDWWIFRHILSYLRSNTLPNELETLKELYKEASFYRILSLQRAIEEVPISQISNLTTHINFDTGVVYGTKDRSRFQTK